MHWRNPNKPEHVADPRPKTREQSNDNADPRRDGYSVVQRRPRVKGTTEPVAVDRARRIEGAFGGFSDD